MANSQTSACIPHISSRHCLPGQTVAGLAKLTSDTDESAQSLRASVCGQSHHQYIIIIMDTQSFSTAEISAYLKLAAPRPARKRDRVSNVLDAQQILNVALKSETESAVRNRAELTQL